MLAHKIQMPGSYPEESTQQCVSVYPHYSSSKHFDELKLDFTRKMSGKRNVYLIFLN